MSGSARVPSRAGRGERLENAQLSSWTTTLKHQRRATSCSCFWMSSRSERIALATDWSASRSTKPACRTACRVPQGQRCCFEAAGPLERGERDARRTVLPRVQSTLMPLVPREGGFWCRSRPLAAADTARRGGSVLSAHTVSRAGLELTEVAEVKGCTGEKVQRDNQGEEDEEGGRTHEETSR